MQTEKPWLKFYGDLPPSIDYPRTSLYEALMRAAERFPDRIAYDYLDVTATYRDFAAEVDRFADALAALGVKPGARITLCMPTSPQALVCFYAANKLGAVAHLIHPLCPAGEIESLLARTGSTVALALVESLGTFTAIRARTRLETLIVTGTNDPLPDAAEIDVPIGPDGLRIERWRDLVSRRFPAASRAATGPDDPAAIMHSSGTTGHPKAILLSNHNFIAQAMMVYSCWEPAHRGQPVTILAIPPISHAFGLGVCCNAMFLNGGTSILVPEFTPAVFVDLVARKRPTVVVGVPSLFDALSQEPSFQRLDLSCVRIAGCGSDTLQRAVKERFEETVRAAGGRTQLLEGYGLTEAVSGIFATPLHGYREGSVGVPLPDMLAKVVRFGTREEAPAGEDGELCVHGPAVMLGYLDQPGATAQALQKHADGRVWLHTGDVFSQDEDGYFNFKVRLARVIATAGARVYPPRVEAALYRHPDVRDACVIGVPDEADGERVKAVVVLKDPAKGRPAMREALLRHCLDELGRASCPHELEFRDSLPMTPVGKVAYRDLVQEGLADRQENR